MTLMSGWRLTLKGQRILQLGKGARNPHELSRRSGISYPTVSRYVNAPGELQNYDASVLPGLLIDGQGLSPEDVLNMRIGDLFELVDEAG